MPPLSRRQLLAGLAALGVMGLFFAGRRRYAQLMGKHLERRAVHKLPHTAASSALVPRPCIISVSNFHLGREEIEAIDEVRPAGVLLHRYNVQDKTQLIELTAALRTAAGSDILIMVDQEGGKIQRLQPPNWPAYPSAANLGTLHQQHATDGKRATYLTYRLIANDLAQCGINANAAPVLDLIYQGTHSAKSHRSFSEQFIDVSMLAQIACDALLEGGVLPIIKHIPGQGRAVTNSDTERTHITATMDELKKDYAPFRALSGMPLAMTSHAIFDALDASDPVVFSAKAIEFIRNQVGFEGLLITDDLVMLSMAGNAVANTKAALRAGNDLLQYSGDAMRMNTLLGADWPAPDASVYKRLQAALGDAKAAYRPCEDTALKEELDELLRRYQITPAA